MSVFFIRNNIPINAVRHDDLQCYVYEGWGGSPIEDWPIYKFYREYLHGNKSDACDRYCSWYSDQLEKYGNTGKKYGGMLKGSLYSLISSRLAEYGLAYNHSSDNKEYDAVVGNAIRERVRQRFELAESIADKGYYSSGSDWIMGIERDGLVYLKNGHHRCAVLKALGVETVNDVRLCRNYLHYRVLTKLRRIIK